MTPPSCTFVPPYLVARLAASDRPALSSAAQRTLRTDARLRASRASPPAPSAVPRAAAALTPDRRVSDAGGREELPGRLVRREGDAPVGDPATDEAYDGLGATYALYAGYGRDSVDGRGLALLASVHYGTGYDNAFWDGGQMVFGDGDGEVFGRFTRPLTVVGHELTHGVTQYTAALDYEGQTGALNESVSDVFGALVEQRALGQTADQASWLIGAGLFLPGVQGVALRSMKAPGTAYDDPRLGKDPQPAHLRDYVETSEDNGGVHVNSGIPNHAFYLAAVALGGRAWERAGQVWYDALVGGDLRPDADFAGFAAVTIDAAGRRYGPGSAEATAVRDGWGGVGVDVAAGSGGG